jgi:hypothetical protein
MANLENFFINPFSNERFSRDKKQKFGEETIARIAVQNNANQFNNLLNDTIAIQQSLFGEITDVATLTAIRESRTQSVDKIIDAFSHRNTLLNNFLIATEVDKTTAYQEFFPQGVQPFTNQLTKGNVEQRIQQMINAVTNNLTIAGGQPTLDFYTKLQSDYNSARGAQLTKKGEIAAGLVDANEKEAAWNDQMFENLLTFALLNRGKPENLKLYMDQSILQTPANSNNDGKGRLAGIVQKNGLPVADIKIHIVDGNINDETSAADGSYTTQYLPTGTYDVEYSKEGNLLKTVITDIKDEGDTNGNVDL